VRRYQGVPAEISTEYGSRSNVSNRMASRRFTRLTTCGVVVVVARYVNATFRTCTDRHFALVVGGFHQ
jgi:hypothetical protein